MFVRVRVAKSGVDRVTALFPGRIHRVCPTWLLLADLGWTQRFPADSTFSHWQRGWRGAVLPGSSRFRHHRPDGSAERF
jgi:hypothetical protein